MSFGGRSLAANLSWELRTVSLTRSPDRAAAVPQKPLHGHPTSFSPAALPLLGGTGCNRVFSPIRDCFRNCINLRVRIALDEAASARLLSYPDISATHVASGLAPSVFSALGRPRLTSKVVSVSQCVVALGCLLVCLYPPTSKGWERV